MSSLVQNLLEVAASEVPLFLKPESRGRIPCHPVEEMDIARLATTIRSMTRGLISTASEDEAHDAMMALREIFGENYLFEWGASPYDDGYYLGFQRKD